MASRRIAIRASVFPIAYLNGNGAYSVNADGSGTINGPAFALVTNGQQAFVIPIAVDGLLYVIQQ